MGGRQSKEREGGKQGETGGIRLGRKKGEREIRRERERG